MKQLLHGCDGASDDGTAVVCLVAALNDRAFALICSSSSSETTSCRVAELSSSSGGRDPTSRVVTAVAAASFRRDDDDGAFACAVARADKSLSVYRVPSSRTSDAVVAPRLAHRTAKRVRGLTFAVVGSTPALVAADAVGDATAWPVIAPDDGRSRSRFLLGHTASVLTAVDAPSSGDVLLTADRDEKIRVSAFPRTCVIKGYLLGHEAFVSSLDCSGGGYGRCVSASGDGTVRLWSYETTERLGMVGPVSTNAKETEDDKNDDETKRTRNNKVASRVVIPIAVRTVTPADAPTETVVAVARDGRTTVQIVRFVQRDDDDDDDADGLPYRHEEFQELECGAHPLALAVVGDSLFVLTDDSASPLSHYEWRDGGFVDGNDDSPVRRALAERVAGLDDPPVLPSTVLERDAATGQLVLLKGKDVAGNAAATTTGDEKAAKRNAADDLPWNRRERKHKDRIKMARRKRRKREERRKAKQNDDDEGDNDDDEENEDMDAKENTEEVEKEKDP